MVVELAGPRTEFDVLLVHSMATIDPTRGTVDDPDAADRAFAVLDLATNIDGVRGSSMFVAPVARCIRLDAARTERRGGAKT